MLTNGGRLLHDNARPHTALVTKAILKQFKWEVLDHPPYSPDLAPSDFHLFRYLKSHLGGKSFHDDDEIKDKVYKCGSDNRRQPSMIVGYKSLCIDLITPVIQTFVMSKIINNPVNKM
ncbi:histone-lysine N-methyltransferase SETMAR [Trichonephila clavipes]|uniref:Histone-lysine N-methyltransferase SETMAR n=1 Tax=Trichonephila clavipes TaxID=2585209 RepID=A0A8X7BKB0_TRICX|nr:histone-lysine N-methyltransferase SETMAR [Trichonephila clavipes]